MNKYKLSVSKGQKKYTILVQAASEQEARERVHKEGYSILSVQLSEGEQIQGKKFYFMMWDDAAKENKEGTIMGEDIFKVYLKLRQELNYNITYLYTEGDRDAPEEEKQKIINALKEQFTVYLATNKIQVEKKVEKVDLKNAQTNVDDFYQKKELEETYKLIEFVIKKLEKIIENGHLYELSDEQKEKLREVYNSIVKIKKSTNVSKLKQIGEIALLKIGTIELRHLEKVKSKEAKGFLGETNQLLKKVGSTKQFIEKDKDIRLKISHFLTSLTDTFERYKQNRSVKQESAIDMESYNYLKTVLLLNKYKKKYIENLREILRNFHVFIIRTQTNVEKADNLLLKGKVISQNIALLKAKKSGKIYSYTYVKKGYMKFIEYIMGMIYTTRNYILYAIVGYAFIFLTYMNTNHYGITNFDVNFNGIFYYIIVITFLCLINLSRGLLSLSTNIVFLVFLFIFGVVNF